VKPELVLPYRSGLYAWYDASAADTITTGTSNNKVFRIADKNGSSRKLEGVIFDGGTVTGATLEANGKNGRNTVLIDTRTQGTGLRTAYTTGYREDGIFGCSNPLTIFAVWQAIQTSAAIIAPVQYSWGDWDNSTRVGLGLSVSGRAQMTALSTNWVESGGPRDGNWICQRAVMNGTSSKLFVNGVYQAPLGGGNSTSDTPSDMNFNLACGDWKASGYFQMGEILFFQGALSDSIAADIDSYLMSRWGIS
jgi:hypothetical protein